MFSVTREPQSLCTNKLKGYVYGTYWLTGNWRCYLEIESLFETLAFKETNVTTIEVAGMRRMPSWKCSVIQKEHLWNKYVRGTFGIKNLAFKIQEAKLWQFEHKLRRNEYMGKKLMQMDVQKKRSWAVKRWRKTEDNYCNQGMTLKLKDQTVGSS